MCETVHDCTIVTVQIYCIITGILNPLRLSERNIIYSRSIHRSLRIYKAVVKYKLRVPKTLHIYLTDSIGPSGPLHVSSF